MAIIIKSLFQSFHHRQLIIYFYYLVGQIIKTLIFYQDTRKTVAKNDKQVQTRKEDQIFVRYSNKKSLNIYKQQLIINLQYIMSAKFDEEITSQFQDLGKKVMNHLKNYCFFVYYERYQLEGNPKSMNLEKLSFKLKDDKNQYHEKYGDNNKNVQLHFYDLENQHQISNSLHDLKVTAQQSKTKLVFFSSQFMLANFFLKAKILNINIQAIPICIYTSGIHSDLSKFLGWGSPVIKNLSGLSVNEVEKDVRKWVQSPAQKINIWSVQIKVSQEGGWISKLNPTTRTMDRYKANILKDLFLSNLSIGYHPSLLLDYQQGKSKGEPSLFNKIAYGIQGIKKFCCLGNSDMRQNTGIVKIDYTDEKGEHEILKYLRDPQMQEDSQYLSSKKGGNRKRVLSVLLSNIDRYFGEKIKNNSNSRMNDQKLELITFQSANDTTAISSISGQINMQFSPDHAVFVQVNDSCYQLERPVSIKVQPFSKARIIINKQTLCC